MKADLKKILSQHGLKATHQRLAMLGYLHRHTEPVAAEDILKGSSGELDLATIYRTLASFEKKGIVRRVDVRKGSKHYERADMRHHHHLVCDSCGRIEDFAACPMEEVMAKVLSRSKFRKISAHSLELFGLCKRCA